MSLRIGILATGRIAHAFAKDLGSSSKCQVLAVGSRSLEKAQTFAEEFSVPFCYGSYEQLVESPEIDAVYIAGPNGIHKEWAFRAAQSGKHVLCEKPMAITAEDARQMFDAASRNGVLLLEAFPFRFQPQTIAVMDLIRRGGLGQIKEVEAGFTFCMSNISDVRLEPEQGGGATWDVGCYVVNLADAAFGSAPRSVQSTVKMHERGIDFRSDVTLTYPSGGIAKLWCSFESDFHRSARIVGTEGTIEYGFPNHTENAEESAFFAQRGAESERYDCPFGSGFVFEADALANIISGGPNVGTTPEETIHNTAVLEWIVSSSGSAKNGHQGQRIRPN